MSPTVHRLRALSRPTSPTADRLAGTDRGLEDGMAGTVRARTVISAAKGTSSGPDAVNQVHLVGRVAAPATSRTLPSGDTVTVLRIVVDRPPPARRSRPRSPTTDTVDCAIWTGRLRQRAASLSSGAIVEVDGALRRRFWRSGSGPVSRYEVEVLALRRLTTGTKRVAGSG